MYHIATVLGSAWIGSLSWIMTFSRISHSFLSLKFLLDSQCQVSSFARCRMLRTLFPRRVVWGCLKHVWKTRPCLHVFTLVQYPGLFSFTVIPLDSGMAKVCLHIAPHIRNLMRSNLLGNFPRWDRFDCLPRHPGGHVDFSRLTEPFIEKLSHNLEHFVRP